MRLPMRAAAARRLAAVATAAALVAAVPGTALANDVYTDYLEFAGAGPMVSPITLEQASALGVSFAPMGTSGSGTLFFDLMAGESLQISLPENTFAFGFNYTSTMALTPSGSCQDADGDCTLSGSGFYGTRYSGVGPIILPGTDLSTFDPYLLTAQADGQLAINHLVIFQHATVVPEPATVLLLGSGIVALGGFGVARRRRERTTTA